MIGFVFSEQYSSASDLTETLLHGGLWTPFFIKISVMHQGSRYYSVCFLSQIALLIVIYSLTHFSPMSFSLPCENVRKPKVSRRFQRVQNWTTGLKWVRVNRITADTANDRLNNQGAH